MFLAGCRSPGCLAAEEGDVLRQFSAGRYAIFNIIDGLSTTGHWRT